MACYTLKERSALWSHLKKVAGSDQKNWDLIVVGGGITGVGVLREAARRGLKALLVEQRDFAWGTSSRSSKMVHGGLRYLATGDFSLTRHSLLERERMLKEAPGLVERMGYYFTLRKKKSPPSWGVKGLLWLYDRIASIRDHHAVSVSALLKKFPGINGADLKGAFYYTDAVTDDSRLVLRVLQEAIGAGGCALNDVKVSRLLLGRDGLVSGVSLNDGRSDETVEVRASVVVNATGAWADRLRNQINPEKRIRPLRGSHIVVSAQRLPVTCALTLMHPVDNRVMFIFPWEGRTVIGTTDLDHSQALDAEASISREEVDYLLQAAVQLFPAVQLIVDDIVSTWAGVRPVICSNKNKDPSKEQRDHAVWCDDRLITVSGGKLTTFRLIALDVLAAAKPFFYEEALHKISLPIDERVFSRVTVAASELLPKRPEFAEVLLSRYGDRARDLVCMAAEGETDPIADTRFCLAECRWALREESVFHLDDLLLRRTRLGLLLEGGGELIFDDLKRLCQQELQWDGECWRLELVRYQELWRQHYFLPEALSGALSMDCSGLINSSFGVQIGQKN